MPTGYAPGMRMNALSCARVTPLLALFSLAAAAEITWRQEGDRVRVDTPPLTAVIDMAAGATIVALSSDGVSLLPSATTGEPSRLAEVRQLLPEGVALDGRWQWRVERDDPGELTILCSLPGAPYSRLAKRFRFARDRRAIDIDLEIERAAEGIVPAAYSLWVRNLLAGETNAWRFWLPAARESAASFAPTPTAPRRLYDPTLPAAGAFNSQGAGCFFLPAAADLDCLYTWSGAPGTGTLEWGLRRNEIAAGATFRTSFRILPANIAAAATPAAVLSNLLATASIAPTAARRGVSNDPAAARQPWLLPPRFAPGDRLAANFDDAFTVDTPDGPLAPAEAPRVTADPAGRFAAAARFPGGDARLLYRASALTNLQQGTLDLWLRPDTVVGSAMLGEYPAPSSAGPTPGSLTLRLRDNRLDARLTDDTGVNRRVTQGGAPLATGCWTHVQLVWSATRPVSDTHYIDLFVNGANTDNLYAHADTPARLTLERADTLALGRGFVGALDAVRLRDQPATASLPPTRTIVTNAPAATPAVAWLAPAAFAPIRALCIADHAAAGDLAALTQLLPLRPTVATFIYALRADAIYTYYDYEQVLSHAHFLDRLRLALAADYDVILLSPLSAKVHLPADVQALIAAKVRAGAGLVSITPHDFADQPLAALLPLALARPEASPTPERAAWLPAAPHPLTTNFPAALLPPSDCLTYRAISGTTLLRTAAGLPILQVATAGKGRVVAAGYCAQARPGAFDYFRSWGRLLPGGLVRKGETDAGSEALTPLYQLLLARSVAWAAGRDVASAYALQDGEAAAGRLLLTLEAPAAQAGTAVVELRFATPRDDWQRTDALPIVLTPGPNRLPLTLPGLLPGGSLKLELVVRGAAGVVASGAHLLTLPAPATLDDLHVAADDAATASVTATARGATDGLYCRFTLCDAFGRVGDRRTVAVSNGTATARGDTTRLKPPLLRVTAELLRADNSVLAARRAEALTGRPPRALLDNGYAFIGWSGQRGALAPEGEVISLRAEAAGALASGVNGSSPIPYLWADFQGAGRALTNCLEARVPCLSDPAFLATTARELAARATTWKPRHPVGYLLSDEVRFSPLTYAYFEGCHDPASLAAFRTWLRSGYGTLGRLNAQWGSSFATWDAVQPATARAIMRPGVSNYAAFADFRAFGEATFAAYLRQCAAAIRTVDPAAPAILSGTVSPDISNGYDWWQVCASTALIAPYKYGTSENLGRFRPGPQWDLARSYAPHTGAAIFPYSAGYNSHGPELFYWLFAALLNQANGISAWGCNFFQTPEGTPTPSGSETLEVTSRFRDGLWDYVRGFARDSDVAVLYSMPSLRVAFAQGRRVAFHARHDAWAMLLSDLGIGWRYVAPQQLATGLLRDAPPKLLLLPEGAALSDGEFAAIRAYLEAGGSVLAEATAGGWDEHGTPRRQTLAQVCGAAAGTAPQRVGGGLLDLGGYDPFPYLAPALQGSAAALAAAQQEARTRLAGLGVQPFATLRVDGAPFRGLSAHYRLGAQELLIALPIPRGTPDEAPLTLQVELPETRETILPLDARALGATRSFTTAVRPGWAAIAALLPAPANAPTVTLESAARLAPGGAMVVRVTAAKRRFAPTAVSLRMIDPRGVARDLDRRRLVFHAPGVQRVTLLTALNDPPGQYMLESHDLLTGRLANLELYLESETP